MARKCDWRYAPTTLLTISHGRQPVIRAVVHPAGTHSSAIRKDMMALELIPAAGRPQWFGVDDARINSQLKMVACGGFINPRNELAKLWKPCRKACDSLSGSLSGARRGRRRRRR
jgi:hypothetical protein